MTHAELDVLAEREKQRARWSADHDDHHDAGELGVRAAELLVDGTDAHVVDQYDDADAWGLVRRYGCRAASPDPRRALVVAAALALAELERIDRLRGAAP